MWRTFFSPTILERARNYVAQERVSGVQLDGSVIVGQVAGSYLYDVSIQLRQGIPYDLDCDCPYAAQGNLCKHMAAVLMAFEARQAVADVVVNSKADVAADVEAILEELTHLELKDLIRSWLKADSQLKDSFLRQYRPEIYLPPLSYYRSQLQAIAYRFERGAFIDYYNGPRFVAEVEAFFRKEVKPLYAPRNFDLILGIIEALIELANDVEMDGSNGEYQDLFSLALESVTALLDMGLDAENGGRYVEWLMSLEDWEDSMDLLEEFILDAMLILPAEDFAEEKLAFLAAKYEKYRYERGWRSYSASRYLRLWAEELLDLGRLEAFDELVKDHLKDFNMRSLQVDRLLDAGQVDQAVQLLLDYDPEQECRNTLKKLDEIYQGQDWQDKRYELWLAYQALVSGIEVEDYYWLKELSPADDWQVMRDKWLAKVRGDGAYYRLLFEEEEFDELKQKSIAVLRDDPKIWAYMDQHYGEEIFARQEAWIRDSLEGASNRKRYRYIAREICELYHLSGGKKKALALRDELMEAYNNRPAMLDEFRKNIY